MLKGFLSCDSFLRVGLQATTDQVNQLWVFLHPVLFEVGDALHELRHFHMLYHVRIVAYSHLIKDDSVGPHVDGWSHPDLVSHLRSLVAKRPHKFFHVGALLSWLVSRDHDMAQAKVTDLCHRILFIFLACCGNSHLVLEDQDVVDFYIRVNDASLVHVPDAL